MERLTVYFPTNALIHDLQDICDRKIGLLKSKIREYQMTRKDVTDEHEMKSALTHDGGR